MEEGDSTGVRLQPATVGAVQTPRQNDAQIAIHDRQPIGDAVELVAGQDQHLDVGSRAHRRRGRLAGEQGHLAQCAANTDTTEQVLSSVAIGDDHLGQSVLDDVHLRDGLAFADQDRAGRKPPTLQTPHDARQLVRGEPLEK